MFDNLNPSPYISLGQLKIKDADQENNLYDIRKVINKIHQIDDKVERETLMKPIREECIKIHNARIAIAIERQKALRKIALFEKLFIKPEYSLNYKPVFTT